MAEQKDLPQDGSDSESSYSDAEFSAVLPPRYVYSPGHGSSGTTQIAVPEKKSLPLYLVCLLCAVLACALGVTATLLITRSDSPPETVQTLPQTVESEEETSLSSGEITPLLVTNSTMDAEPLSAEEIFLLAREQVVGITTDDAEHNAFGQASRNAVTGSGVILTEDGYILTDYHVIAEAYESGGAVYVLSCEGDEYAAEVVGVVEESDLAVLKISAEGLSPAALGDFNEVKPGQTIYAFGNPLGELSLTVSRGLVASEEQTIRLEDDNSLNLFQINAAVSDGSSGGPVYNSWGQVVGIINTRYALESTDELCFVLPVSDAHRIANELITKGYVSGKVYVGITYSTVSPSAAQYFNTVEGAMVHSVNPRGCGKAAGLRVGDIITAVGETAIDDETDFSSVIDKYHGGDTAQLTVYRAGDYVTLSITFDEVNSGTDSPLASGEMNAGGGQSFSSGEMGISTALPGYASGEMTSGETAADSQN